MRGLIIGKFLPPHRGHQYLIDFARSYADDLSVLVCTLAKQPIPGRLRFEWMRQSFGGVRVIHHPDENPEEPSDADSPAQFWALWKASILSYLDTPPDLVFASEPYGETLAAVLGAQYIPVDPKREGLPVSGTLLRDGLADLDPASFAQSFDFLLPAARPYFVRRVAVVGPESSGKSTLTKRLAASYKVQYGAQYVPEYARTYLEATEPDSAAPGSTAPAVTADLLRTVLRGHRASEDALAMQSGGLLLCDTEALTTKLWARLLLGAVPAEIEAAAAEDRYALYLVTRAAQPWTADPQRYQPDFQDRAQFSADCESELKRLGRRYVVLDGDWAQREAASVAAVDALLAGR